jgi:putative ABC transport system substrate-binding protein
MVECARRPKVGEHMRRREFITLVCGVAAEWPLVVRAQQQPDRMRRVGVLMNSDGDDPIERGLVTSFLDALQQQGWTVGRNVQVDVRFAAGDVDAFQKLALELTNLRPDVILAASNLAATALQHAARDIPIVFTQVSDPIGRGLVATLARPGGNATGFINFEASMGGKWVDMLNEIAPKVARIALLFHPGTSPHIASGFYLRAAQDSGRRLSIETDIMPVHDLAELDLALNQFAQEPNSGLIVLPDAFALANADIIVALAGRLRLPTIYAFSRYVSLGGLLCYGIDRKDQYPRAATYVDRILRGEKPADLPVQAPTKYETVINLKAAKALGITVPQTLLAIADEVIE